MEQMTEKALERLLMLDMIFIQADSEVKRQIVGSIFPEGLIISEVGYRTTKVNEVAAIIYQIDLQKLKTGTNDENSSKFRLVPLPEQMSNQFLEDLEKIAKLVV